MRLSGWQPLHRFAGSHPHIFRTSIAGSIHRTCRMGVLDILSPADSGAATHPAFAVQSKSCSDHTTSRILHVLGSFDLTSATKA